MNALTLLPVELEHILTLDRLALHHRDPFDRLLVAQALSEQIPPISRDPQIQQYAAPVVW